MAIPYLRLYGPIVVPLTGLFIGVLLERHETQRMTLYRDKSALYGRTLAPGEEPSWPRWPM